MVKEIFPESPFVLTGESAERHHAYWSAHGLEGFWSSSANPVGRFQTTAWRSWETLPARAGSTSGSSPSALARRLIFASEGGGTRPRSTLLR